MNIKRALPFLASVVGGSILAHVADYGIYLPEVEAWHLAVVATDWVEEYGRLLPLVGLPIWLAAYFALLPAAHDQLTPAENYVLLPWLNTWPCSAAFSCVDRASLWVVWY